MKKILLIALIGLLTICCFACVDEPNENKDAPDKAMMFRYDTVIRDADGIDKCLWEDGSPLFGDFGGNNTQQEKSALLHTDTEYDVSFYMIDHYLDFSNEFYLPEFEYNDAKLEIKNNSSDANHFVLTVLQSCDSEKIKIKLTAKSPLDDVMGENGQPVHIPSAVEFYITVSTVD